MYLNVDELSLTINVNNIDSNTTLLKNEDCTANLNDGLPFMQIP